MITGFNTDIEWAGVVYHVQTEDKGLDTPLILSLIYTRGQILASKRSRYDDLIAAGFDEKILVERLNRQHKLLCAAVKAGRIEDLIRQNQRELERRNEDVAAPPEAIAPEPPPVLAEAELVEISPADIIILQEPAKPAGAPRNTGPLLPLPNFPNWGQPPPEPRSRPVSTPAALLFFEPAAEAQIVMRFVTEKPFLAGAAVALDLLVEAPQGGEMQGLAGAIITVKVMGTSFRPMSFMTRTDRFGRALVSLTLPEFKTGRAALLASAEAGGHTAELRRIVLPRNN